MIRLGINIDHVATLRNSRTGLEPSPIFAAQEALRGGADSITVHLREDRRHIRDEDVYTLAKTLSAPLNLEMSIHPEIVEIGLRVRPEQVSLVPERREEQTTECGLDVIKHHRKLADIIQSFAQIGTKVSLFVDPDLAQLEAAYNIHCRCVELHTGSFAESWKKDSRELVRLEKAAKWCYKKEVRLHAGHGLNYHNTYELLHLPKLAELNIGHSIVSRSIFTGLYQAVLDMRAVLDRATDFEFIQKGQALIEQD